MKKISGIIRSSIKQVVGIRAAYFVAFFSIAIGLVLATNQSLKIFAKTTNAGVLKIEYEGEGPLFNETALYPGFSKTKNVNIFNTGNKPHSFSIAASGYLGTLADVLRIRPKIVGQQNFVWDKTIREIANSSNGSVIIIGLIAPKAGVSVDFEAYLPEDVGNEYQGKSTLAFDFVMGNESTDEVEDSGGEDEGEIINDRAATTVARVFEGQGSTIADDEAIEMTEQQENILEQGKVAGVNEEGEAQGAKSDTKPICYWWWLLSVLLAAFLIIWAYINKKSKIVFAWVWPIFAAAILYFLHWGLHEWYTPSKYCDYFILIEMALLAIYYIATGYIKEEAEDTK